MSIEHNTIYCENCLDTMQRMDSGFIDLTVTSPPYDNLRDYNGFEFDFQAISKELFRTTKDGGVVVWIVADATVDGSETGTSFRQALGFMDVGFRLHDTMIYSKHSIPLNHNRYEQMFEYMFILSKNKPSVFNPMMIKTLNPGGKKWRGGAKQYEKLYSEKRVDKTTFYKEEKIKGNIWNFAVGRNDKTKHNAPFPEALARDHIISWSNPGDIVYDPFMGSGTAAKMAYQLDRQFIGSEISQQYVDLANKRLKPVLNQGLLFRES